MGRTLMFGKKANITIRTTDHNIKVKRNVYFKNGVGTYVKYKNKNLGVAFSRFNNSAYSLFVLDPKDKKQKFMLSDRDIGDY